MVRDQRHARFIIINKILHFKDQLVILKASKLITDIIEAFYMSPTGGHLGESKTFQRIAAELFWVSMHTNISK